MIHRATDRTHGPDGTPTISELERRNRAWQDEQTIVMRCANCDWTHEAPAAQAREEWQRHLADDHPDLATGLRRRIPKARQRAEAMKRVQERRGLAAGDGAT